MTVSPDQKRLIDSVVSLNETGKLPSPGAYSTVTVLTDGAGISYGKHQSTDRSGSLDAIVMRYIDLGGTMGAQFKPYLDELERNDSTKVDPKNLPQWVKELEALLATVGKDLLMQKAQDQVFDESYWVPAVQRGVAMGLKTALAYLVLYDTCIQSGPGRIDSLRKNFPEKAPSTGGDEHAWVIAFLGARKKFLLGNSNPLVQKSVYRVDGLLGLCSAGLWELTSPFMYRGTTVA